ncbi:MAG: ParB N-terminal domain-containing protein [Pseudobacteriovorax sp.]|nr:ParB N-terminal domain-containing protein [Pseudobacteriovorax sp.]
MTQKKRKLANSKLEQMVKSSARQVKKKKPVKSKSSEAFGKIESLIKANGKTVQNIPIDLIELNENIRRIYDEDQLSHLAKSLNTDGLIQFPTLCLKPMDRGNYRLVCRNGHRRILAAKSLGWKNIECIIKSFDSVAEELYLAINANIQENVFYLDIAKAYQDTADLGETDGKIASRVGVNPRTVGWYRRLLDMSMECQELCRRHPDIFTATWAIQLARSGPIPAESVLLPKMKQILAKKASKESEQNKPARQDRLKERDQLQSMISGYSGSQLDEVKKFTEQLVKSGFLSKKTFDSLRKNFFPAESETFIPRQKRQRPGRAKRA